jgi:NADH-quinone oxidoreductase subunit E
MFTEENLKKLEALKKQYPTGRALTLPALWLAQEQFGWLSEDTMKYVAEQISVPFNHLYSVASFYTMYNKKPTGKFHIQVCTNISCQLLGSEKMVEFLCTKLGVKKNEITSDGKYSVSEVECLGSCGTAPVMQINDDYHEKLTAENIESIIQSTSR